METTKEMQKKGNSMRRKPREKELNKERGRGAGQYWKLLAQVLLRKKVRSQELLTQMISKGFETQLPTNLSFVKQTSASILTQALKSDLLPS
jgi:hypothetical protein